MHDVMGLIFSNMHEQKVRELTARRCMGSIPVGGRYRLIDFVLSGFTNAGLENVGVVTKNNYQSLMGHLGGGREWDLSRKRGGLIILPPFGDAQTTGVYRDRIEALANIMGYIKSMAEKYVVMADCDMMANIDYNDFVRAHIESRADMTVMYKSMHLGEQSSPRQVSTFILDSNDNVRDMLVHPDIKGDHNVYINNIIINKDLLIRVVNECYSRSQLNFDIDVLQAGIGKYKINAYGFEGHVGRLDDMKTYYNENLALLDPKVREALFPKDRPIYTKVKDDAPVRYGLNADVSNSLIADGCIIEGEVKNSVIFRRVRVAKGARIENSIIMQGSRVGENCNLQYVICDKNVTVHDSRVIIGFDTYPVYISKGSAV